MAAWLAPCYAATTAGAVICIIWRWPNGIGSRGIGRQLVNACLAKLRQAGIQKCNIFIFANNAAGMKFWTHESVGNCERNCG